jgi:predicted dehydrogenase
MCRKRGRIVLVGVTGLELSRADFFEKELTFQVSCSYGPGRYDPNYEEKGNDYPIGFVRWTEQRNFEAVLDMMADGKLDVKPLISHHFEIEEAEKAYELVGGTEKSLGILLKYPGIEITEEARTVNLSSAGSNEKLASSGEKDSGVSLSFIGSGNYATKILIPAFKEAGAGLRSVATNTGVGGVHAGRKHGFIESTTDTDRLFADAENDAIVIATRHDSHAGFVLEALRSGKHVFVEKPLCLTIEELDEIAKTCSETQAGESDPILMVGFNRRFSPHVIRIKQLLDGVSGPKAFVMTINAGKVPADHWTHDSEKGGGRIVGEACHFIDLLRFLSGNSIKTWQRMEMESSTGDTVTLQIGFADGSVGTIHYFANGSKAFPKERLEVFASGGILQLDNFRKLRGFGWPGFQKMNLWRQDKGQKACARAFMDAIKEGDPSPVALDEILEVSRVAIDLQSGTCS